MSRSVLVWCVLAAAVAAVPAGCGKAPGEHAYSAGFKLKFPEDWELREDYRDLPLVAVAPRDDEQAFPVNVNVRIIGNPDGLELDEFYERHFDDEVARATHHEFRLIDESDRPLGRHPARRVVYAHRIEPDDLQSLVWVILAGRRGYIITCNAHADQFADFEPVFDAIAASFEPA